MLVDVFVMRSSHLPKRLLIMPTEPWVSLPEELRDGWVYLGSTDTDNKYLMDWGEKMEASISVQGYLMIDVSWNV